MDSFGRVFKITVFGESHGDVVGVIIDGCPAGLKLTEKDFESDLSRRRGGAPGTTSRRETDKPILKSGVFNKKTTGAPIAVLFKNTNINPKDYSNIKDFPRPSHADFAAMRKYSGYNDPRGGGHFSGRLTLPIVAAGVVAKKMIEPINVRASLTEAGGNSNIEEAIKKSVKANDSIGGLVECEAKKVSLGLGEPFFDSVESLISHAVFSIPGVKGIEFGSGFSAAKMWGSEHNDPIVNVEGRTKTNNAGGVNGGITNGNDIIFRVAIKPPSSIKKAQYTYNFKTKKLAQLSIKGRHDACIALRAPVVVEAVTAIVLADLRLLEQKISGAVR